MKKWLNLTVILITSLFMSCKINKLIGKTAIYQTEDRDLSINFFNDSFCVFKQSFYCAKIPLKYRYHTFTARYNLKRLDIEGYNKKLEKEKLTLNLVIFRNIDCPDCKSETEIPNYASYNCEIASSAEKSFFNDLKLGTIYHFNNDTMTYNKDYLTFSRVRINLVKPKR